MAPDANQAAVGRQPNIFSRTADGKSVVTVVGAAQAPTGPWSYVTGVPNTESDISGPPAPYLTVAAWAA